MKFLITGGAGFIGSHFIRLLLKDQENEIINLDKLTYAGNLENLKDVENNPNYKFVKGDIADKQIVDSLVKDVDCIVNFAAETHVDRSIVDARQFIDTDIKGTFTLVESARKNNIKRFVQISTDEVYGHILEGSFKEDNMLQPRNPYSASKAGADLIALSFFSTYRIPIIITRSSNNFGPNQYPEKAIPLFITNILEGKKVPLYGDGLNIRDWIYVVDNCEAIKAVLDKGKKGEIYNISSGNEIKNIELTKNILGLMGKDETSIDYVEDRLGHDRRYSLDYSKIKDLGWKPRFEFEKSLSETIIWYKENVEWWKRLKK